MISKKNTLLVLALVLIAGTIYFIDSRKAEVPLDLSNDPVTPIVAIKVDDKADKFKEAIELVRPSGFLNTDSPIAIGDFIGKKVVLVDFWTYSCINCQRTLPYINAWYDKYTDKGLQIVGIHSPEFEFEKIRENVAKAIERFGIKYPVVQDNDFGTWRAYQNRYWPRKYLIDIDGYIVYDHIGEGGYEETEKIIQELLMERAEKLGLDESGIVSEPVDPANKIQRPTTKISPEIYFGSRRNERLANGTPGVSGSFDFEVPFEFDLDQVYLDGKWNVQDEYAQSDGENSRLVFRFKAKEVYMVASSMSSNRVKVLIDGKPALQTTGQDVDENGFMTVQDETLYHVISLQDVETHTLELIPEDKGFKAFTFTFG